VAKKKPRTPKPPRSSGDAPRAVQAPQRRTGPSRTARAGAPPTNFFMRYFWPLAAGVVALVIVGVVLGIVLTRGPVAYAMKGPVSWKDLPGLQTGKPPWPAQSDTVQTRLGNVNLTGLPQEALAFHIHQHLDLYVDGKHVTIPRFIGIARDSSSPSGFIVTEMHTHRTDNVIHVESPKDLKYQLKQFMGEWGVRLTAKCLGSFKGSCDNLQWWVNGKKQKGNPADLVLKSHQEIVISVGKPPAKIPSKYDFPAGE
jgi:hypothetical protein